jgi:C1A family cysteine protease
MDVQHNALDHGMGWHPSKPDHRDYKFSLRLALGALPPTVDLTAGMPPVYNQGVLGSCTANAIGADLAYQLAKQGEPPLMPSRLFIYYNERALENTIASDAGAEIRDGFKVIAKQGICDESEWPYDPTKFAVAPPASCYTDAAKHLALTYQSVAGDLTVMKSCLASLQPIVIGIAVYSSFESAGVASSGVVPLPDKSEAQLGGHAMLACGYNDLDQTFLVRNSWGPEWGKQGYCTIPYAYLTNPDLGGDYWSIQTMN